MSQTINFDGRRMRVCVLGATGSVGASTLDVMARHPDRYEVFALTAHQRVDELLALCVRWKPRFAALGTQEQAKLLRDRLQALGVRTEVLAGPRSLVDLASHPEVDAVMAAIVGAAGLEPCLAAAKTGKRLMLANKEALVVGGALFMQAIHQGGATLLPIDSEHSAIFQCLPVERDRWLATIDHIVLTASGGPFRKRDLSTLRSVTPEEACAHPTWVMGRKISVDSATMMNKALEVIEAKWLFELKPSQVKVVIHPQSIIHSMVVCKDRSVLAQMGTPDMRVPIAVGLSFPDRVESGAESLRFETLSALTFEEADEGRFPGLYLAWKALEAREGTTAVLNAANEVAVASFLDKHIRFDHIHRVNASTLETCPVESGQADSLEGLLALDARAREFARRAIDQLESRA